MFTGIIEALGTVVSLQREGTNVHLTLSCPFTSELQIDQSLAHNGVCLTVVAIEGDQYTVTAIDETLQRSNIGDLQAGDVVNLERCTQIGARLDGHIVQGHVDATGRVVSVEEQDGSWVYTLAYPESHRALLVEKGSVTINGVSLTVVDAGMETFSVAIIPYTYQETTFHTLKPGQRINLEFDIVGKYVMRLAEVRSL